MPKGRVVIVEDDVALEARPLQKLLESHDFEIVGIAKTIADARKLADKKPDVALVDVMIPPERGAPIDDEGGLKAARYLQQECGASVVFITGRDVSTEFLSNLQRASADAFFLLKPLNSEQTIATVELALLRKRSSKVVFVCYAHEDRVLKNELISFLSLLAGVGVDVWDDSRLSLGDRWRVEVSAALRRADVAIIMVSAALMNSRFIRELELPSLLAAETRGRLRVIPVFAGAVPQVALEQSGLLRFQGINGPDDPVGLWTSKKRELRAWGPLCDRLVRGT